MISRLFPLILALGMAAVDTQIVAPLLNTIARDLGIGLGEAGLLVSAYSIASALFAPFAAPATSRKGALFLLKTGIVILFAGTVVCAAAPGYGVLLSGRILAGIGGGLTATMCHVYVAQMIPYEERARAVGWLGAGFFAAAVAGIPLGALLAEKLGWRWTFGALAVATIAILPVLNRLPEAPTGESFLLQDFLPLLSTPGVRPGFLAFGLALAGVSSVMTYLGAWLELDFGLTPKEVGLVYMIGGFAALYGGPAGGRLSDRLGKKKIAIVANLIMSLFILMIPETRHLGLAVVIVIGMHFAGSCRFPSMISMLGEAVPAATRGPLLLANHSAILLGISLGSWLGSLLFPARGMAAVALAGGLLSVAAAAIVPFMRDPKPGEHIPEAEDAGGW